jgi:hypothetical protein
VFLKAAALIWLAQRNRLNVTVFQKRKFQENVSRCFVLRMVSGFGLGCLLVVAVGCGQGNDGFAYQPVSGTVTVDGEPAAGLTVAFVPQGTALNSGRPSSAVTDETGRYEAKTLDGKQGAAIGEHLVSISSEKMDQETIPSRYNKQSTLRFTVPAEGTDAANFELTTKKR